MSASRSALGLIGMAGGVGLLVFGLQAGDTILTLAGVAALTFGLMASFRRICMKCGADWRGTVQG